MPKISIIVPIYNVEQYLDKCLQSIINQTFKDIEIICVNDGSPDNSLDILKKYEKVDNRIIIINQDNGGLSDARNSGLKVATAPHIMFVDSDDWLELNACEVLYNNMINNDCDLVIAKTNLHNEINNKQKEEQLNNLLNSFSKNLLPNKECFYLMNFGIWNKLFKKSIIDQYTIRFPIKLYFEDAPFLFSYISVSTNILYIENKTYNYRINHGSILNSMDKNNIRILDHFTLVVVFYNFLYDNNLFKKYEIEFWNILCYYIWWPIYELEKQHLVFDSANKFLKNKEINHLKNKISKINYKLLFYLKNKQYNNIYIIHPKNIFEKIIRLFFYKKSDINQDFKQIKILGITVYKKKHNFKKILFIKFKK